MSVMERWVQHKSSQLYGLHLYTARKVPFPVEQSLETCQLLVIRSGSLVLGQCKESCWCDCLTLRWLKSFICLLVIYGESQSNFSPLWFALITSQGSKVEAFLLCSVPEGRKMQLPQLLSVPQKLTDGPPETRGQIRVTAVHLFQVKQMAHIGKSDSCCLLNIYLWVFAGQ